MVVVLSMGQKPKLRLPQGASGLLERVIQSRLYHSIYFNYGSKRDRSKVLKLVIDRSFWGQMENVSWMRNLFTIPCFCFVQSLTCVQLFVTPWTTAHQASLSFTVFLSLLKLVSIESVMPSNHLILFPPFLPVLNLPQHQGLFQWVGSLHRWPKYWSFCISPSNEYSGLVSFKIDWFDLLRDSRESSPALHCESINFLVLSLLYSPTLTSVHDYWKSHSFDYMDLFQQSDISVF